MNRRDFVQSITAAGLGIAASSRQAFAADRAGGGATRKLDRIGLELYSVRKAMAADPDKTLAAVSAIGYKDVEVLWSFGNFGRSPQQLRTALANEGLRAPSAHISPETILIGWNRSLDTAKYLGHQYLIVPSLGADLGLTLDDWKEWADHFNTAGAIARRAGVWLAFHNESEHMKPIDGQIPYDVFINRLDPSVVRLQLDVGNMILGGGDPMQYLSRYKDRYWAFHLKDALPDRSSDTELGTGTFDFKKFLAAIPELDQKPTYVEQEHGRDELASARIDYEYLHGLDF
ncbi:MAG TPA: sugar phosphate isomerase/epimerase [Gemmatimonadaceae bacterium]|nr:sugar phosphate isomerase/epimerase [Gemmatimonadaceae bacterium]